MFLWFSFRCGFYSKWTIMYAVVLLILTQGTKGLSWAQSFTNGSVVSVCFGENASFPWKYVTETEEEEVLAIVWSKRHKKGFQPFKITVMTEEETFTTDPKDMAVEQVGNAGLKLLKVVKSDLGVFLVTVVSGNETKIQQYGELKFRDNCTSVAEQEEEDFSVGLVVGIVLGCTVVLAVLVALCVYSVERKPVVRFPPDKPGVRKALTVWTVEDEEALQKTGSEGNETPAATTEHTEKRQKKKSWHQFKDTKGDIIVGDNHVYEAPFPGTETESVVPDASGTSQKDVDTLSTSSGVPSEEGSSFTGSEKEMSM